METKTKKKKLPEYRLIIDEDNDKEGIDAISFVSEPAIETPWIALSKQKELTFKVQDTDKQIVFGPVLIPGQLIYRRDFNADGDANVYFAAEDVEKIVQRFFRNRNNNNVNLEHSLTVKGATLFQAFISDKDNGVNPKQYSDLPDKTFFVSYKVDDPDLWQRCKDGTFTGFSLEGWFDSLIVKQSKQQYMSEKLAELIQIVELIEEIGLL